MNTLYERAEERDKRTCATVKGQGVGRISVAPVGELRTGGSRDDGEISFREFPSDDMAFGEPMFEDGSNRARVQDSSAHRRRSPGGS